MVTADSAGLPDLRQLPALPRLPPLQAGQEVGGRQPRHVLQWAGVWGEVPTGGRRPVSDQELPGVQDSQRAEVQPGPGTGQ